MLHGLQKRFFLLDIDECADDTLNECYPTLAMCKNSVGSYDCECNQGYQGDGRSCEG